MNTDALIGQKYTTHAIKRSQQRSIPPFAVELLERFGTYERCGGGERVFFDKAARKRLSKHFGRSNMRAACGKLLNTYAIIADDGHIVTVAYRT